MGSSFQQMTALLTLSAGVVMAIQSPVSRYQSDEMVRSGPHGNAPGNAQSPAVSFCLVRVELEDFR